MRGRTRVSNIWGVVILLILIESCNTSKKLNSLTYFSEGGDTSLSRIAVRSEPVIQPGDRLNIVVHALNPASAEPYNLGGASASGAASGSGGYVVESDGTIQFPQIGKITVAGMHRKQLIDTLSKVLVKYVTDPVITIEFINFKITVLGEVNRPGALNIPEGKVTLIEAIGIAGDLTYYSRRDNIVVIREKNGIREFGKVNILSKDAFSSPYFVLQQNDVVYVEPTKAKAASNDQSLVRNISIATSILSVVSTLVVLIINVTK